MRIQKIREIILVSFVILSGFVRYPGKPKVEQILILLSTAFGTKNITDKIKRQGFKVEIFQRSVLKNTTCPLSFLNEPREQIPLVLRWQRSGFFVSFFY